LSELNAARGEIVSESSLPRGCGLTVGTVAADVLRRDSVDGARASAKVAGHAGEIGGGDDRAPQLFGDVGGGEVVEQRAGARADHAVGDKERGAVEAAGERGKKIFAAEQAGDVDFLAEVNVRYRRHFQTGASVPIEAVDGLAHGRPDQLTAGDG